MSTQNKLGVLRYVSYERSLLHSNVLWKLSFEYTLRIVTDKSLWYDVVYSNSGGVFVLIGLGCIDFLNNLSYC